MADPALKRIFDLILVDLISGFWGLARNLEKFRMMMIDDK